MKKNKSILITGITGFVGSNLKKSWEKKYNLYGLSTKLSKKENIFFWNEIDKLPEVDIIIHLAGIAHDTKDKVSSSEYFKINTDLTQKIFDYFIQSKSKKFIYFSSIKATRETLEKGILTEEMNPKPTGPYGESKIKAEKYLLSKEKDCNELGKNFYILRPTIIHGKNNRGNLNLLYKVVKKGYPWPLVMFNNQRSFLSIDNLIFFINEILKADRFPSGIYHLADDETVSTNRLIEIIANISKKKVRLWKLPVKLIFIAAKIGDIFNLPLDTVKLKKLTNSYVVSNDKIKQKLAIGKLPLTAEEGLIKTIKSFRDDTII